MNTDGRIHFLDAARAILMFLGIPYHVAMVYRTGNDWEFATSDEQSVLLSYVAEFIHIFRMPLFFMVAGYFAMLMLSRKDPGRWFGGRIFKLGVPLVAAGLVLNPISLLVQDDSAMLLAYVGDHWLAHLWFLPTLIYLCAVLAVMQATPLQRWFERGVDWLVERPAIGVPAFLVVTGSVSGFASMLGSRVPDTFILTSTLLSALGFLPYMLFGAAMRVNRRLLVAVSHSSFPAFAITMVPLAFAMMTSWGGGAMNIARVFAITMVCFGFACTLLTLCRLLLDRPSKRVRNIADASFTVYLVHFPLLNVFYKLIAPANMPVPLEFALLVASVAVVSYFVHRLIARSDLLMLLFNGASLRRLSRRSGAIQVVK